MKYGVAWSVAIFTSADTVIADRPDMRLSGSRTCPFLPPRASPSLPNHVVSPETVPWRPCPEASVTVVPLVWSSR
jgi:hypothetical protein